MYQKVWKSMEYASTNLCALKIASFLPLSLNLCQHAGIELEWCVVGKSVQLGKKESSIHLFGIKAVYNVTTISSTFD